MNVTERVFVVVTAMSWQLESDLQEGTHTPIRLLFARVDYPSCKSLHDVRVRTALYFPHDSADNLPGGVQGEPWDCRVKLHRLGYWHHRGIADICSRHGQGVRKTEAEVWNGETGVPFA